MAYNVDRKDLLVMRTELTAIRAEMEKNGIQWYIVPTTDFHGTEYVNDYFKCREFLSGFTGSAGTLLVGKEEAYLWTDGRYFLQADIQLRNSGVTLMKLGEPNVPTIFSFLKSKSEDSAITLGFDGRVISKIEGMAYENLNCTIKWDRDLVDKIWKNRPTLVHSNIYNLPIEISGKSTENKLAEIRRKMLEKSADVLILTSLEEIAWLFNMRGGDVENTPVFLAFAIIENEQISLFLDENAVPSDFESAKVHPYNDIENAVSNISPDKTIWLNGEQANYSLFKHINSGTKVIDEATPLDLMKAVKNSIEIDCTYKTQIQDGLAMVKFIHWLKNNIRKEKITEISAADYLENCRKERPGFFDLSFSTISGFNSNGAIIHYDPTPESNATLAPNGFLLVDSGGQYNTLYLGNENSQNQDIFGGTTDITRTIALGALSGKMKKCYTAVLKGHIALASAKFPKGTTGFELDKITRKPICDIGFDYNHGTGHGVGHILSVHEGPQSISKRESATQTMLPGMITSDEPGIYIEGEFGIRLESLLLCKEDADGNLYFDSMTYCPFDLDGIVPEMLTEDERIWLNTYHRTVYEKLAPHLPAELSTWLKDTTKAI